MSPGERGESALAWSRFGDGDPRGRIRSRSDLVMAAAAVLSIGSACFVYGLLTERRQLAPFYGWLSPPRPAVPASAEGSRLKASEVDGEVEGLSGRWHRPRIPLARTTNQDPEQLERLAAVGYLGGSAPAPAESAVTAYDVARAQPGLNLYTSGHRPEAVLMTMQGEVLHRWTYRYQDAFGDHRFPWTTSGVEHWRRVHLLPGGELLAIHEGQGILKLSRDSKLVWAVPIAGHHDLQVDLNGQIHLLTRRSRLVPELDPEEPVLEDLVTVLDRNGRVQSEVSLLECLRRSAYSPLLAKAPGSDLLHTNTLQILDAAHAAAFPAARAGDVLVSFPTLDTIAVVDLQARRVVWALGGMWSFQHQPTALGNGRVLLLDNQGVPGASRVLEIDPRTQRIAWSYAGSAQRPFFTRFCGATSRLANGDTLVVETDQGRAFELAPDGAIVWEFLNPHRAGRDGELIASLFDLVRVSPDFVRSWLPAAR